MSNAYLGSNQDKAQRKWDMNSWRPLPGREASQTLVPEQLGQVRGLFWITTSSPFHTAVVTPALVSLEEGWLELSLRGCGAHLASSS